MRSVALSTAILLALSGQAVRAEDKKPSDSPRSLTDSATYTPASCFTISSPFSDVLSTNPQCPFIRELFNDGIAGGCAAGRFCPNNPVTRGQMAVLLERVMRGASSWDGWRDGPTSPGGYDWGSKTTTLVQGTMMEFTHEGGEESGIYFDGDTAILWSPGDSGLLRIFDQDDLATASGGEKLRVNSNNLSFHAAGPSTTYELRFFGGGGEGTGVLRWDPLDASGGRFELDNDLAIVNDLSLTGALANTIASDGVLFVSVVNGARIHINSDDSAATEILVIDAGTTTLARFREDTQGLDVNGNVNANAFDLAESFVRAEPLEAGDVVRVAPSRPDAILKASRGDKGAILGVVSTKPGFHLGGSLMNENALKNWNTDVRARFSAARGALQQEAVARNPGLAQRLRDARSRAGVDRNPKALKLVELAQRDIDSAALDLFAARTLAPVALSGRVPVKVDASAGPIAVGDPLGPSSIPGVATKATSPGLILGTALEPLESGRGKVLMFVNRGWWGGTATTRASDQMQRAEGEAQAAAPDAVEPGTTPTNPVVADGWTLRARGGGQAEMVAVSEAVEEGDVLVMDAGDAYRPSAFAEDATVVGVVASRPALLAGRRVDENGAAVVVAGMTRVKVDATWGAIHRGDLLVSSPTRGHAMRADDPPAGTIVGKALESLESGAGTIRVLVMLR